MATTNGDLRAQLREVEVTEVEETGRELGKGAYGVVKEIKVKGHRCAGKKLHEMFFIESSREEQRSITARFAQECLRHSKLHHPNIIHLIGVHFRPGNRAPTLIMELMPRSLMQALEQNRLMPSHVKYRILLDVTYGLHFLHDRTPPIIHRDLTANNILLSESMRAKIADLGQAKIVSTGPMSETPGNPAYMPPESFTDNPVYDAKLDMFSFGALIIHTLIHDWPTPKGLFRSDPAHRGRPIPLTEIERRAHHLKRMGGHPLKDMVTRCLQNDPALRPTAAEVIRELEGIIRNDPPPANIFEMLQEISTKTKRIQTLTAEKQALVSDHAAEVEGLNGQIEALEGDKQAFEVAITHNEAEIDKLQREITLLRENLRTKDTEIANQRERLHTREEEVAVKTTKVNALLQSRDATAVVSSYSSPARMATQVTSNVRNCNVLVVGKSAAGISTVCNQIIGEEYFDIKPEIVFGSVTMATSHVQRIITRPDNIMYNVKVINTIGFFNVRLNNDDILKDIKTYMQHHIPEGVSLVLFVMRKGRLTDEESETFEFIMNRFSGISPISALVLTCCEGIEERAREYLIQDFCANQHTADVAKFMQKGIYPVGFPDLSTAHPKWRPILEEDMAADAETLRNLVFRSTDMLPTKLMIFDQKETEKTKSECNIQ